MPSTVDARTNRLTIRFPSAAWLGVVVTLAAAGSPAAAQPRSFATTSRGTILPVRTESDPSALPALRGDRFEIRLDAWASARAFRRTAGRETQSATGVMSIDAAAASAGVTSFEPEFPGEAPPAPGSNATDFTAFYIANLAPGASLENALDMFRRTPGVASAGAMPILSVSATPNDSLWSQSWWFFDPAGRNDVHAPEAWDVTVGDSAIVVGILDSGVIPYHPDLGGTLPGWPGLIWTHAAERDGVPGVDDDGNGYVDDVHGWDFVGSTPGGSPSPGEDGIDEDNDPNDFAGHGTAVAGLVGALTNNGAGIAGTNWNVRLMPLRMAWAEPGIGANGVVDMAFAARALRYATRMGANVVNCSFQTLDTDGLYAAASAAIQAGVVIVGAAGNGDDYHDLQDREDVIAVAATDDADALGFFSNRGEYVDLAAPGVDVASTFVNRALQATATDSLGFRQPSYQLGLDGTSFASPLVAGGVALMLAQRRAAGAPPFRPMEAVFRMRETADPTAASPNEIGGGRLNLVRAVTEPNVSFALRMDAGIVGSPVVVGTASASERVVFATENARLMFADAAGDTIRGVSLPALPIAGPAAADMGGGNGGAIFVTLAGGQVAGFDPTGAPLAGWPISLADDGVTFAYSPVLADVDGDSTRDVVCTSTEGTVFAFDLAGNMLPAFPITTDGSGIAAPIAVAELDAVPGADMVVAVMSRRIYALRADAAAPRLTGWPKIVSVTPKAPLVAKLTLRPTPCIAVAFGTTVRLYETDGTTRMDLTAPGTILQDPIAADVDGDGFDELIVGVTGADAVASLDSVASTATWTATAPGPVGPLLARGNGSLGAEGLQVLFPAHAPIDPTTGPLRWRMRGLDGSAAGQGALLHLFPQAGTVAGEATAFPIDADGNARLLAGGGDSLLFYYRLPRPALTGDPGWFTARANFARTGSRMSLPPIAVVDDTTGRVTDLAAIAVAETTVTLQWTAPGNVDGAGGRPRHYDIHASLSPILDDQDFADAPYRRTLIATVDSGGTETFVFGGLQPSTHYYFALKPFRLPRSNSAEATTLGLSGSPLISRSNPSRVPVEFLWSGTGAADQRVRIHDLSGRLVRVLSLGAGTGGTLQWDGRDESGAIVPAGMYFARLTSGSLNAQTRVVLLP